MLSFIPLSCWLGFRTWLKCRAFRELHAQFAHRIQLDNRRLCIEFSAPRGYASLARIRLLLRPSKDVRLEAEIFRLDLQAVVRLLPRWLGWHDNSISDQRLFVLGGRSDK